LGGSIAQGQTTYGADLVAGAVSLSNKVAGDDVSANAVTINTTGNTSSSGKLKAADTAYSGIQSVSGISGADAGNYDTSSIADIKGDYKVDKRSLGGSIAQGQTTYGADLVAGAVSLSNTVAGDDVSANAVTINTAGKTSSSGKLKAADTAYSGIQSVGGISGADAGNYTTTDIKGDYKVDKRSLGGSIAQGQTTYGADLVAGAVSLSNKVAGDDVAANAVTINTTGNTSSSGKLKAADTAYSGIQSASGLSGADAGNYAFTEVKGDYKVDKRSLGGSIAQGQTTYGADLVAGAVSLSNKVAGDDVAANGVAIATAGNTSSSGKLKAADTAYSGIQSVSGLNGVDAGNYTADNIKGDYKVDKRNLTGSIAQGQSIYGADLVAGAVSLSNTVAGDDVAANSVAINTAGKTSSSGKLKAADTAYSGIQSVNGLNGVDAGNYTVAPLKGDYKVDKRSLSGSISQGQSVYGANLTAGTVTLNNKVAGDDVKANGVAINTAGNTSSSGKLKAADTAYSGIQSVNGLNGVDAGNYTADNVKGDYKVDKRTLGGSIALGQSVYGADLVAGTVSLSNKVAGDDVAANSVAIATAGNTSSSGKLKAADTAYSGIQSVSGISGADAGNYAFAAVKGDYKVYKRNITGSIAQSQSVYGADLVAGAVTLNNKVAGDDIAANSVVIDTTGNTSSSGKLKAADTAYSGIQSVSGINGADAANYTVDAIQGDYKVDKRSLGGSITQGQSIYGEDLVEGTVSLSNKVAGDDVSANGVAINTAGNTSSSGKLKAADTAYSGIQSVSGLDGVDAGNYAFTEVKGDYKVDKRTLGGGIAQGHSVYGADLVAGTVSLSNKVAGDDVKANVAINTAGNTSSSGNLKAADTAYSGIQSASGISGVDAGNYDTSSITNIKGDYKVDKRSLGGSIAQGQSVYGADLVAGAVSLSNKVAGDDVNANAVTINTAGKTSSSGKLKAADTAYSGIQSASGVSGADADNYTFTEVKGDYKVDKRSLSGSITQGESVYGADLVAGAVTLGGKLAGDDVNANGVVIDTTGKTSSSGKLKAADTAHSGIQSVSGLNGVDADNYAFTEVKGDYKVNKRTLGGSIAQGQSVYGADLTAGAVTLSNKVAGDNVNTNVAINTAGNTSSSGKLKAADTAYSGIQSVSGISGVDAGNYDTSGIANIKGDYKVDKRSLGGSISQGQSVYGADLVAGAVSLSNTVAGDDVSANGVAINTTGKTSSSGKLKAADTAYSGIQSASGLSGADADNYTFTEVKGDYKVDKRSLGGSITQGQSVYGADLVAGTVGLSNTVAGDDVTANGVAINTTGKTSSSGKLKAADTAYSGIQSVSGISGADAGNYAFTEVKGDYKVDKKTVTTSYTAKDKVFDDSTAASVSGTLVGVLANDSMTLTQKSAIFADTSIGPDKLVIIDGLGLQGTDASNYELASTAASAKANITSASVSPVKPTPSVIPKVPELTPPAPIGGDKTLPSGLRVSDTKIDSGFILAGAQVPEAAALQNCRQSRDFDFVKICSTLRIDSPIERASGP
jgi:hypothetical protein